MDRKLFRDVLALCLCVVAALFVLFNAGALLGFASRLLVILTPFWLGAALAFVLSVPLRFLEGRVLRFMDARPRLSRLRRPVALALLLALVALVVYVLMSLILPELGRTVSAVIRGIPNFIAQVDQWLQPYGVSVSSYLNASLSLPSAETLDAQIGDVIDFFLRGAALGGTVVTTLYQNIISTFFTVMFVIYFLAGKERLCAQVGRLLRVWVRDEVFERVMRVGLLAKQTFCGFITGQCLEALILGGMFFVAMSLLGMPYVLLISIFIAVTALVPVVGAWMGCIVGALLILLNDPLQALWFVVLFLFLQQIEGNVIYPRVMGNAIGLPSLWVLFAVVLGQGLFGIVGMLVFIPLTSVLYALLREFVDHRLQRREESP
ncbi:MAG TPA: AI-2E family transporter [Candidatus Limiplasma stercoravium]|nr:AI-2E family transporter [Candidatus Limiplasma stercoravium]